MYLETPALCETRSEINREIKKEKGSEKTTCKDKRTSYMMIVIRTVKVTFIMEVYHGSKTAYFRGKNKSRY